MKPTRPSTNANQLEWWSKDAVVYFVAAGDPAVAVKIGVTTWDTVDKRLRQLQSSNHERLQILGVIPFKDMAQPMRAAEDREREIHRKFVALQRFPEGTRGSEWFTNSPGLASFITDVATRPEEFGFSRYVHDSD